MRCRNRGVTFALVFLEFITIVSIVGWAVGYVGLDFELLAVVIFILQPLTLIIIIIQLACSMRSFYKGAFRIRMIWLHLFNCLIYYIFCASTSNSFESYLVQLYL